MINLIMVRGLDHIHYLHEMCGQELQELQCNIQQFKECTAKMLTVIEEHWHEVNSGSAVALIAYDNFITSISNMMDLSRKFNLHLKLNNMEKNSSSALFQALQVNGLPETNEEENTEKTEISKHYSQPSIPPAEENSDDSEEVNPDCSGIEDSNLYYPQNNLAVYKPNSLLNACVTYVQDPHALLFYVCDATNEDTVNVLLSQQDMLNCRQYAGFPPENEIFGLVLDNIVLRAVRRNPFEFRPAVDWSKCTYTALLLDFGEVVQLNTTEIMYRLPKELREKPAQAMLCQLQGIRGSNDIKQETLGQHLQELLYKKCTFRIASVEPSMLRVHLEIEKIEKEAPKVSAQENNTNPFIDDLTLSESLEEAIPLPALPREPLYYEETKNLANGLTREDMEMLHEEPICTSNAMKAVMGYNPKDDLRICRFYDPKTRSCFKGANCRQEHTLLQPEGWTKDVLPAATVIDNRVPTIRYVRGTILNITPTHVGQLERFYAQINDSKASTAPLIFNPEDVPDWNRLQQIPLVFEMVLARYEDGLWYRAKVLETEEHSKMIKIFYVDYGNQQTIHLRELARCDYAIAKLPFQAILCRLADVRDAAATPEQRKLGINMLCRTILNQALNVRVAGNHDDLLIHFVEERFAQLPDTLIKMGCMHPFKNVTVTA